MNEETLNNTTTVHGDQHIGGFVLLESVDSYHWRAYGWSAFFARLVLSQDSCKSFRDTDGHVFTELSAYNVMQLGDRLEIVESTTQSSAIYIVPPSLAIHQSIFDRWKNSLPEAFKSSDYELQSIIHG